MDSPLAMLGFLSIFNVIGAVALANGLRGVWSGLHDKGRGGCRSLFFVVWGAMFGCLPFGLGLELATEEGGTLLVLLGEALIWGSVFLSNYSPVRCNALVSCHFSDFVQQFAL